MSKAKPTSHCRNWKRYRGQHRPSCNGGYGCYACWKKYLWETDPSDHTA